MGIFKKYSGVFIKGSWILPLTKLQKPQIAALWLCIMVLLKAFHAPVIYSCSSCSHLIKPSPIIAVYAYWYACLFMHGWVQFSCHSDLIFDRICHISQNFWKIYVFASEIITKCWEKSGFLSYFLMLGQKLCFSVENHGLWKFLSYFPIMLFYFSKLHAWVSFNHPLSSK